MILSSFKIYTDIGKLEPATRSNLDSFKTPYQILVLTITIAEERLSLSLNSKEWVSEEEWSIYHQIKPKF
jgi:hypothetical protein